MTIAYAKLDWNDAGIPISEQFDDVYFSNDNGLEETRYVFLAQNNLPQRWQSHPSNCFVIAETGFGTGLNFLAAWQWFDLFRQQNPDSIIKKLHFISFEKYPLTQADLVKAHQAWPELADYTSQLQACYFQDKQGFKQVVEENQCHRIELDNGFITLDLWIGDVKHCLPKAAIDQKGVVDAWFLDGFAPSKNPQMWNQALFNNMVILAKQEATCATFTAAGFVRRGLIDAGFDMKKVAGFGRKREMLAGKIK